MAPEDRVDECGVDERGPDLLRFAMPVFALGVVVMAAVIDPGGWPQILLLVLCVVLFAGWAWLRVPVAILTVGVIVPVVAVQLSGDFEISTFLLSLLAIVVTGWTGLGLTERVCLVAMLAAPPVIAWLQPGDEFGWQTWVAGIVFPAFMGWGYHRQEMMTEKLEETRAQLAERTLVDERRQIARDVHDLVGHGLAAMMVQVTSARHVLRSEPDSADEALRTAEGVGRQSMNELRRTVALLRRDGDSAVEAPLPGLGQIEDLVGTVRAQGVAVEHVASGDLARADPGIGLTLYRIAQEALVNASRHAPHARTTLRITVEADEVVLTVDTRGPVRTRDDEQPHYGLRGMRERAQAVGGTLRSGPSPTGWLLECRIPLRTPDRRSARAEGGAAR